MNLQQGKEEIRRLRQAIAKFIQEEDAAAKLQATQRMKKQQGDQKGGAKV